MTEPEMPVSPAADTPQSAAAGRPPRSWPALLLLVLTLLAVIAVLGYGGWRYQRYRAQTLETIESQDALLRRLGRQQGLDQSQINDLTGRVADLAQADHEQADALAGLGSRLEETQTALQHLDETVQGGRRRLQLLGVEQLLLIAADRAQLSADVRGALTATTLAQERLGAVADPRLFEVRKALAEERAALAAVNAPDQASMALALGAIIGRVDSLPLKSGLPQQDLPTAPTALPPANGRSERLWRAMSAVGNALFTVHRVDLPQDRLFSVEQQSLIAHVLQLKLENARAALWAGQTEAYRQALSEAVGWLNQYYRPQDPSVLAAMAELERLQRIDPHPPLPELGRALGLLRAYLDAQA